MAKKKPKPKLPAHRPSDFTQELADTICERLAGGECLTAICKSPGMPVRETVWTWRQKHPDFDNAYARARQLQMECWEEQLLEISDDGTNDFMTIHRKDGEEVEVENKEVVNRSRLRVDTRKWLMARIHAQKYGDKIEQTLKGDKDAPVTFTIAIDRVNDAEKPV